MPEYWFVVSPALDDLYVALKTVLYGRAGLHVIKERRTERGVPPSGERRTAYVWQGQEILIAERWEE
jgi:hypothetical protein